METKLGRIAGKAAQEKHPIFTSLYHLLNEEMLEKCHRELSGNRAVGVDKVTKEEYDGNLEENIRDLVERLKKKSYKPQPTKRVYIPKANGGKRPLGEHQPDISEYLHAPCAGAVVQGILRETGKREQLSGGICGRFHSRI